MVNPTPANEAAIAARDKIRAKIKQIEAETTARRDGETSRALRAMQGERVAAGNGDRLIVESWQAMPLPQVFGVTRHKRVPRSSAESKADFCARNPDAPSEGWRADVRPPLMRRRPIDSFLDLDERRR
ncbi:hypothetical protein FB008_1384 [Sinorhizobium medicae]|uniref:hypothetical protein n=1 Tax=Sinorhizobium medicae TaxID=110321 RepID=UPI0011A56814|nr:hypothetical protein [Sinorhizobium medicae]TWA44244.1 hypothetical protein FB008_1384 [Sinorhizobium medicae]